MTTSKTSAPLIPSEFKYVRIEPVGKKFSIRTARLGNPIGSRLCKSNESLPTLPSENLSLETAIANAKKFDAYLERQEGDSRKSKK